MRCRIRTSLLSAMVLALAAGCASSARMESGVLPETPLPPADQPLVASGLVPGVETVVGAFDVRIDTGTMTAEVMPVPLRAASSQPPQAIVYDLDIETFRRPDSFAVESLRFDADGNLALDFSHRHPFPQPNFAAAVTGSNRADLGYTGRLLILADDNSASFFDGDVTLDPTLVTDADGYVAVGDLLVTSGLANDAFPYVLLADDMPAPLGNYGTGGWQRATPLPWIGQDYVHPGADHTNTFTLDRDVLTFGSFVLRVALVIKYVDPRGEAGREYRFPPPAPSPTLFAYRLPYSAIDVSKVDLDLTGGDISILNTVGSTADVALDIRDWDAQAAEAADDDISDELDVTLVPPGTSGYPVVEIDAPDLSPNSSAASTTSTASGIPGDEIRFDGLLVNEGGSAPLGDYLALARVTDPSASIDDSATHFGVDGVSLLPTRTPLEPITYQTIPYTVVDLFPNITDVTPDDGCQSASATFSATNDGIAATSWSWNFGGGASPNTSTNPTPAVTLSSTPGTYNGTVTACNGIYCDAPFNFSFVVNSTWGGTYTAITSSGGVGGKWMPQIAIYDGKPVLVSRQVAPQSSSPSDENILFSSSSVAEPSSSSQWTTSVIDTWPIGGWVPLGADSDVAPDILVYNNRLYVTYADYGAGQSAGLANIAVANSSAPFLPSGPSSWSPHLYDATSMRGRDSALVVHNNRIAISYFVSSANQLWVAQATTATPSMTSDWSRHQVSAVGWWSQLISFDDGVSPRLVSVYTGFATCGVSRATTLVPASAANWNNHELSGSGTLQGMEPDVCQASIGGNPRLVIAWGGWGSSPSYINVAIAQNAAPTSQSNYTVFALDSYTHSGSRLFYGVDVEEINGRVTLMYNRNGTSPTTGYARATTANPTGVGSFAVSTINAGSTVFWPAMTQLSTGALAVVFRQNLDDPSLPGALLSFNSACTL